MRIFLAGASGVVGRRLVPLLVAAGHQVTDTTRSAEKARSIEQAGAAAVVIDVFDAPALAALVATARPDVIIHQLTDLPAVFDRDLMAAASERNSRIRITGTGNLVAAACAARVPRMIAQSIAFIYAPGPQPYAETDPLVSDRDGEGATAARGVLALERLVTGTPGIDGIVLRYGRFFGPGTWRAEPGGRGFIHVDAAAHAALLAVNMGPPGIYNIAEDDGEVSIAKARHALGFAPAFRMP